MMLTTPKQSSIQGVGGGIFRRSDLSPPLFKPDRSSWDDYNNNDNNIMGDNDAALMMALRRTESFGFASIDTTTSSSRPSSSLFLNLPMLSLDDEDLLEDHVEDDDDDDAEHSMKLFPLRRASSFSSTSTGATSDSNATTVASHARRSGFRLQKRTYTDAVVMDHRGAFGFLPTNNDGQLQQRRHRRCRPRVSFQENDDRDTKTFSSYSD